jgi:hypothetical protein
LKRVKRNINNKDEWVLFIINPSYRTNINDSKNPNSIQFIEIINDTNGYHSRLQNLIKKYEDISKYSNNNRDTEAYFSFNYE